MSSGQKKVLIVEDDDMIISMYKTKLEQLNYAVFLAHDGLEGLEMTKKEKPDLVLLDIIMPQLDGFSVLEQIKGDSSTKNIPVIMLTNLGTDEDKEKGKLLGAVGYLVKSNLTPSEVGEEVAKYFKK